MVTDRHSEVETAFLINALLRFRVGDSVVHIVMLCPILYSLGTSPTLVRRAKMTPENRGGNGLWKVRRGVLMKEL